MIDASTLAPVAPRSGELSVDRHEVAELTLSTRKPVAFDPFCQSAATGRFVIVDGFDIAGGGIVADGEPPCLPTTETVAHRNGRHGGVVWLTGRAGKGSSTIAAELERELCNRGRHACVLDHERIEGGLCSDLAFTARDRSEQMRRVGEVAKLFHDAGVICIAALIRPKREERDRVRRLVPEGRFVEIRTDQLTVSESVLKILDYFGSGTMRR